METETLKGVQVLPRLSRQPALRRESNVNGVTPKSLKKIHDDSERRLSTIDNSYFEKLRRATVRHDDNEANLNGRILEKVRQNSVHMKKLHQASRSVSSHFTPVTETELFRESLNTVINRIGQGRTNFEDEELFDYVRSAFGKLRAETENLVQFLKDENASAHTLQIILESAQLKKKPKTGAFCSTTIKEIDAAHCFSMCNPENTRITCTCSSQRPLWDESLSLPLETTRGYVLVIGVWQTKKTADLTIVNDDKKCIGTVEIDLNSQPISSSQQWWDITSKKGKNKGKLHIGLKYTSSIDRTHNAVMVHAGMLSKFLSVDCVRGGSISTVGAHILQLQKKQQNLTLDEFRYAYWYVKSELYLRTNTKFEELHGIVSQLIVCINRADCKLSTNHVAHLYTTFTEFQTKFTEKMCNLNAEFPYTSETSVEDLEFFVKCYQEIIGCRSYAYTHSGVIGENKSELEEALRSNCKTQIAALKFVTTEDDRILDVTAKAKDATKLIRLELKNENRYYVPVMQDTCYKRVLLREINEAVSNDTVTTIARITNHLGSVDQTEQDDLLNESLALYISVAELKKLCQDMAPEMDHVISQFHQWFYNIIDTWLVMVQSKQRARVARCVQVDTIERIDMHLSYSSSVIDVATMNEHLCNIKEIFDFPDEASRFAVISKLNKQICESTIQMSELLYERGEDILSKIVKKRRQSVTVTPDSDLLTKALVILSTLNEAGAKLEDIPAILNWAAFKTPALVDKMKSKRKEAEDKTERLKSGWIRRICGDLIEPRFTLGFKKYVELLYKGDNDAIEEVMSVLANELNKVLVQVDRALFEDVLHAVWERVVLPRFNQHTSVRPTKINSYYDILRSGFEELSDWFTTEAPGLARAITSTKAYQLQVYKLQNLTIPLEELFFRYYDEERLQEERQTGKLGIVKFTANLTASIQNKTILKVGILECRHLPHMDTLTLCDAQARITLQPKLCHIFSHLKVYKTKTVKNTLNPSFNEQFDMTLYVEGGDVKEGACLQISLWDKDTFSPDDFIGEALLDFRLIPWDNPETFELHLAVPDLTSPCYDVLNHRGPYDKLAEKFVNERRILVNDEAEITPTSPSILDIARRIKKSSVQFVTATESYN